MLRNYASEALPRYKLHHLCEQRLAYVHAILRVVETQKHRKTVSADSNRGHPQIVRNHTQYCTYSPPQTNEPDTSDLRYGFPALSRIFPQSVKPCPSSRAIFRDPAQTRPNRYG